jgi:ribosomal protein S6--L-glutamate ligase
MSKGKINPEKYPKLERRVNKTIGWKEWFSFKDLGLPYIKGKIDTGAKTSSLHAFNIKTFKKSGKKYVQFDIHPIQNNKAITKTCKAPIIDYRYVSDSSGKKEKRYVIESCLTIGKTSIFIEITLANRDTMAFRMLLGREAIKKAEMLVDVNKSFLQGSIKKSSALKSYES